MGIGRINTNIAALRAYFNLTFSTEVLANHQQRITTGLRVNMASDDPASFVMAKNMTIRVSNLATVQKSINQARDMLHVVEGGLNAIVDTLREMKDKALEAADGSIGTTERISLGNAIKALGASINDVAEDTEFNNAKLLSGTYSTTGSGLLTFRTGVGVNDLTTVGFSTFGGLKREGDFTISSLGLSSLVSTGISTISEASNIIAAVNNAITYVNNAITEIGAKNKGLKARTDALAIEQTNTESALTRIRDADTLFEAMETNKLQIRSQATIAMLAQANVMPQMVLQLLGR
ncbi:MAG TPA: flagellin [Candidatus Brocadiia bacterium]|nr:flagellin [Planctomycetota bacterium]MDO8094535.1 flagellin [Candidatus Brocadiales bacterium]